MYNPGKYDDACTAARLACKADGIILIVLHGEHGEGFSAQMPPEMIDVIPDVLRRVADKIEKTNPADVGFEN